MISDIFSRQLDYIFFFYGLAFVLLMAVCSVISRRLDKSGLPWMLLGYFGLVHGIAEWLDMLAASLGDTPSFSSVRLVVMALSFVLLAEFGRQGLRCNSGRGPGAWIYLPLIAIAVAGGGTGMSGLNAALRYSFGLFGGIMTAIALGRAAKANEDTGLLRVAAAVVALYAVAAGAIVPKAAFFPAAIVNHNSFLEIAGVPIQLVRGILAVLCTTVLWSYHQRLKKPLVSEEDAIHHEHGGMVLSVTILLLLMTGWVATNVFGSYMLKDACGDILHMTRFAASSINLEGVRNLSGTQSDMVRPDYIRLREQLEALHATNRQLHRLRILQIRNGTYYLVVDSAAEGTRTHKEPGSLFQLPPDGFDEVMKSGVARTLGPYQDVDGVYFTGFAPLLSAGTGRTSAVFCIDVNAADLKKTESFYRLLSIITTLLVCSLITGFFIVRQRLLETSLLLSISAKMLREKQRELEETNRNLEDMVSSRTASLTEKNEELKLFAYIASHDLQEPLRTITSFVQLLAKKYQGKLDMEADEFIAFVIEGTHRMKALINDLLSYSRVEFKARSFVRVDCEELLKRIKGNLHLSIRESGATITSDPLPVIVADETQMVQLLQNLIGNAIKFKGGESPRIHLGFRDLPEAWELGVADNGIGIKEEFFERIFVIFQRLHAREQYDGTGIGLAVCKKIVERHGGKITVASEPGLGTTFTFTIRKDLC